MKVKLSRMLRSALALLLAFSMVVGYVPAAVFAQEKSAEPIKYVSLGDSMTNGYGLKGYDATAGVEDYGEVAYPNQFAKELAEIYNCSVDHAQLAMSGIRTEDIHWLLEFDYENDVSILESMIEPDQNWNATVWNETWGCGDYWTLDEIANHGRTEDAYNAIKAKLEADSEWAEYAALPGTGRAHMTAVIAKYFQEKVTNADVITLSVGNGNIGVFGFGRILETIGFSTDDTYKNYNVDDLLRECDEPMLGYAQKMVAAMYEKMGAVKGENALMDVVVYIAISLALNYAGTVDAILQMNPDVEIVLVAVMNTFGNEDRSSLAAGETSIGDLMGLVVDPINVFIAALPTYMQTTNNEVYKDAKFYYAEADKPVECWVETYGDDIKEEDSVIRSRFVDSIVGYCDHDEKCEENNINTCDDYETGMIWGMVGDMFNSMLESMLKDAGFTLEVTRITLEDIKTYEENADDLAKSGLTANEIFSCAVYLAFEQAICASANKAVGMSSIMGLGSVKENGAELFGGVAGAVSNSLKLDEIITAVFDNVAAAGNADIVAWANDTNNAATMTTVGTALAQMGMADEMTIAQVAYATANTDVTLESLATSTDPISVVTATLTQHFFVKYAATYAAIEVGGAIKEPMAGALATDSNVSGLMALFGRCMLGNGLGGHPSKNG